MPPSYEIIPWCIASAYLLWVFAFGATVGSFLNVVAYRLPLGLNLVTPPSRCPQCETKLTWRENIPVLGWILLRGRCRFCKSPISVEYPLVEFVVGLLFAMAFAMWFMTPSLLPLMGADPEMWKPEWAEAGFKRAWPMFFLMLALIGSLVAATLVDAKTFTIPLGIPWFMMLLGLVVHPLYAALYPGPISRPLFPPHDWTIPTGDWTLGTGQVLVSGRTLAGIALGGTIGVVLSNVLLKVGLMPRSFADYEEWEAGVIAEEEARKSGSKTEDAAASSPEDGESSPPASLALKRAIYLTAPAISLMFVGFAIGLRTGHALPASFIGAALGLLIGLPLRSLAGGGPTGESGANENEEPVWAMYPHARREMIREVLFVAPAIALAWIGALLLSPGTTPAEPLPLWIEALVGSVLGCLIGGGVVWAIRIGGSLAFGKEAMGMGDVHLMAGVGAILGCADPTIAFFIAPALGIGWAMLSLLSSSLFKRAGSALPYGPHLAAATVFIVLFKPMIESGLGVILGRAINLP